MKKTALQGKLARLFFCCFFTSDFNKRILLKDAAVQIASSENFEQRVEKMRSYFESLGMVIPPRKIYNGYSFDGAENQTYFDRRMTGFNEHWFTDVDYEYNLFKDLTK